ncbi:MAG: transcriptional repressor [Clostridiales bacterium]|jgi:Fur family ferric uptake transcriptional regulator|nr:transcriptional repressor [Clostridiales bacterium]MDR2713109.1 transcriptional repressor [Clostridiales bacterium]
MRERPKKYHTKQSEAILTYIASLPGENHTPAKVADYFATNKQYVGRTTVYRQLERLVKDGKARKYRLDGIASVCYQYVGPGIGSSEQCHLKCDSCGESYDLECQAIPEVTQHIYDEYDFWVNENKTIFYGTCHECRMASEED